MSNSNTNGGVGSTIIGSTTCGGSGTITVGGVTSGGSGYTYGGYTSISNPVYTSGGGGSGIASATYTYSTSYPSITTQKLEVAGIDVGDCMKKIMQRLSILEEPSQEKLDKHVALKKAYENYKMLEALFIDEGDK